MKGLKDSDGVVAVTVVIVHYRTPDLLRECLESIEPEARRSPIEVLVVDNASEDEAAELIRQRFSWASLIRNSFNYGFAIANNQGFRRARGRYVMPLNPDTELLPGALPTLVAFMDENPTVGMAAPVTVEADGSLLAPWHDLRPFDDLLLVRRIRPARRESVGPRPYEVPWLWGTGFFCRRSAVGEERLFSEETFLFAEEYELCVRVKRNGFRLFVVPDARIRHHVSMSFRRTPEPLRVARRLATAALWRVRRRHFGTALAALNQVMVLLDATLMWLAVALKGFLTGSRSDGRALSLMDYRARIEGSLGVLLKGERFLRGADEAAWSYFNRGERPPLPPVSESASPTVVGKA